MINTKDMVIQKVVNRLVEQVKLQMIENEKKNKEGFVRSISLNSVTVKAQKIHALQDGKFDSSFSDNHAQQLKGGQKNHVNNKSIRKGL
jgi:hypothetical protein